ncbi:TonB-dependent copper receptor, partial [Acinetobacter baumannii]
VYKRQSQFARESLGLRFEKKNITDVIKKIEGQVNYSYNDHIMDNFSLREFNPQDGMSMPMASNVARRTLNARLAMTNEWSQWSFISGVDTQNNKHSSRSSMRSNYLNQPRVTDMIFHS